MKLKFIYPIILLSIVLTSCESEEETQKRLAREELQRIEQDAKLLKEREEKAIFDKFINNSLSSGSTPYSYCFGSNSSCSDWGCSQIKVKTPFNSDVLVTIKKGEKVVRHAFIKGGSTYIFELPNGIYQPFFYYGKGWNPEKVMRQTDCGTLKGGFVTDEHFGKDNPKMLVNNILEYELILQQNGNFKTKPSNLDEAF